MKKRKNPSSKVFGKVQNVPTVILEKAMKRNKPFRKMKRVKDAIKNPDKWPIDYGTCWQCWRDISGKWLSEWRKEPYSEMKKHDEVCPLCFYSHWKGRVWYPFRYLRGFKFNPSKR